MCAYITLTFYDIVDPAEIPLNTVVLYDCLGMAPMLRSKGIHRFFSAFDESKTAFTQSITDDVSSIFKDYTICDYILY